MENSSSFSFEVTGGSSLMVQHREVWFRSEARGFNVSLLTAGHFLAFAWSDHMTFFVSLLMCLAPHPY